MGYESSVSFHRRSQQTIATSIRIVIGHFGRGSGACLLTTVFSIASAANFGEDHTHPTSRSGAIHLFGGIAESSLTTGWIFVVGIVPHHHLGF